MTEVAANLVDRVVPERDVRQYVLTVPYPLRFAMAFNPKVAQLVLDIWTDELQTTLSQWSRDIHGRDGETGLVTFIQRFGGDLRMNLHFHTLMLDGVYTQRPDRSLEFLPASPPDDDALVDLLSRIATRVEAALVDEEIEDTDGALAPLYAAAIRGRSAGGPQPGQNTARLGIPTPVVDVDTESPIVGPRCVRLRGFSLHANTRSSARDREALERLCGYTARGPISNERLTQMADGRLRYELKRAWRDGTQAVAFSKAELVERLMALIPRPFINITRYHGVLAPNHRWRAMVVRDRESVRREDAEARLRGLIERALAGFRAEPSVARLSTCPLPSPNWTWAELIKRAYDIEILTCPRCGGPRKEFSVLSYGPVVRRFLECIRENADAPEAERARPPPEQVAFGW